MGAIAIERLQAGLVEDLTLDISPGLMRIGKTEEPMRIDVTDN